MTRLVPRPASLMLLLVAVLLLSGCADTPSASTSVTTNESAPTSSATADTTTTPGATTPTGSAPSLQLPEPETGVLSLDSMIAACDLVVYGKVLAELPGRWNGPNADEWTPQFPDDACIVYRSWIVQVMSTEAGFSPVGDLVTVHTEGGTVPSGTVSGGQTATMTLNRAEPEIAVGDEVLLFLTQDDLRYGGTYQLALALRRPRIEPMRIRVRHTVPLQYDEAPRHLPENPLFRWELPDSPQRRPAGRVVTGGGLA